MDSCGIGFVSMASIAGLASDVNSILGLGVFGRGATVEGSRGFQPTDEGLIRHGSVAERRLNGSIVAPRRNGVC
jgi:hypothetical protein